MPLSSLPQVLLFIETWIDESVVLSGFINEKCNIFRHDRNKHGGEVLLLIDKCYSPAARFSNDHKIYPILTYLTKILRHAKMRFDVRAVAFSKHISACRSIILRNV